VLIFSQEYTVYLLGTAHISERSAQLADRLVRDVHPDGIFVELDLKRAGGVPRQAENVSQNKFSMLEEGSAVPRDVVVPVLPTTLPRAAVASPDVPPALPESKAPKKQGFFDGMREKALAASANVVGGALKGMYQNLGDNGFRPGEEFAAAVRAGSADNAAIILGDQDVEVTLRRLTQAMAVTDLSKLNDASVQSRFSEIMPGGADTMPTGSMNVQDKEVLTTFVEEIKSRENVRALMKELKEVAPAMVQAMLTERDAYMAAGIDTLNEYECIVAVMGIAHIDGVENNLRTAGWTSVSPKCRVS